MRRILEVPQFTQSHIIGRSSGPCPSHNSPAHRRTIAECPPTRSPAKIHSGPYALATVVGGWESAWERIVATYPYVGLVLMAVVR